MSETIFLVAFTLNCIALLSLCLVRKPVPWWLLGLYVVAVLISFAKEIWGQ